MTRVKYKLSLSPQLGFHPISSKHSKSRSRSIDHQRAIECLQNRTSGRSSKGGRTARALGSSGADGCPLTRFRWARGVQDDSQAQSAAVASAEASSNPFSRLSNSLGLSGYVPLRSNERTNEEEAYFALSCAFSSSLRCPPSDVYFATVAGNAFSVSYCAALERQYASS